MAKLTIRPRQTMEVEVNFPIYFKNCNGSELLKFKNETTGFKVLDNSIQKTQLGVEFYLENYDAATAEEFYTRLKAAEETMRFLLQEAATVAGENHPIDRVRKAAQYEKLRLMAGTVDHEDIRLQEAQDMGQALVHHYEKDSYE